MSATTGADGASNRDIDDPVLPCEDEGDLEVVCDLDEEDADIEFDSDVNEHHDELDFSGDVDESPPPAV